MGFPVTNMKLFHSGQVHTEMNNVKAWLMYIRLVVIGFILLLLLVIFIYNIVTPAEKDISKEAISKIINLLPAAVGAVEEWPTNSTNGTSLGSD